jgi:hypothetical protein
MPSVNGFKTDMASLLETCVLWSQLINSNVPEEYLSAVICFFMLINKVYLKLTKFENTPQELLFI